MAKKFNIHEWQAKQRLAEEKYNRLPIRDNVMSYASQILNQINDYENNVGPGEQMIDYNATREAARALMNAVDRDEEGMMNEVQIKKVVDQSMSNDDIGKLQDVIRNNDLGKTLNTIAVIVDQTGGMPEGAAQMIADLVPGIVSDEGDKETKGFPFGNPLDNFPKIKSEDELGEVSATGTGASVSAGSGEGYATPRAFKKKRNKDN